MIDTLLNIAIGIGVLLICAVVLKMVLDYRDWAKAELHEIDNDQPPVRTRVWSTSVEKEPKHD